jgi:hypothetical protein
MSSSPLLELVKILAASAAAQAGTELTAKLAAVEAPTSVEDMQKMLQQLASVPPGHYAEILGSADTSVRENFHRQALLLSMAVSGAMPSLSHEITMLRLVLLRLLPAMKHLPEDNLFGTSAEIAKQYKSVDYVARMAKPEESAAAKPADLALQAELGKKKQQLEALHQQHQAAAGSDAARKEKITQLEARLKQLGIDPSANPSDDLKSVVSNVPNYKTALIVVSIFLAVIIIAFIVYLIVKGNRKTRTTEPMPMPKAGVTDFGGSQIGFDSGSGIYGASIWGK